MDECAARGSNYEDETENCEYGKSFHLTNEIFETLLEDFENGSPRLNLLLLKH